VFETEVHEDRSVVAFGAQQLGVWIASVIWALITVSLPVWLSQFGPVARTFEAGSIIGLAFAPAYFCGRLIHGRYPHFALSGRWIWLLPSGLMALLLLNAVLHSTLGRNLGELFCPPSDGEQWWAVLLGTYPILGCAGYALGTRAGSSRSGPE
jgi:hypothetical protein